MINAPTFSFGSNGLTLTLNNANKAAGGPVGAFARYIRYARITAKMVASADSGMVTTVITMSDRGDEIDWETVGKTPSEIQSNLWYNSRALANGGDDPNRGRHGRHHNVTGGIAIPHIYELDWKSTGLTWSVDGRQVRNITTTSENVNATGLKPGENYYPTEAALIKIGLWGAQDKGNWAGDADWSGVASHSARFEWLAIQCYDASDRPVAKFGNMATPTGSIAATIPSATANPSSGGSGGAPAPVAAIPNDKTTGTASGGGSSVVKLGAASAVGGIIVTALTLFA
ncbi:hypothetical protein HDV00_002887 [Rhizophlyctis rosea]|nr:hypothetical protein HDV00_002887 [Rhizophlyctis rosea]